MGWLRRRAIAFTGAFVLCGAVGGQTSATYATDPLDHGRLVVWVVRPAPPTQPTADVVRGTLHTQTAGSFGQIAGDVGQTNGSYGRNPSELPSQVTSQNSSDAGQTAGGFGHELSTIAGAGASASGGPEFAVVALGRTWADLQSAVTGAFPGLQASFTAVSATDLDDRLRGAAQTRRGAGYPDVLVGDAVPALYAKDATVRGLSLAPLGASAYEMPGTTEHGQAGLVLVTQMASHPAEARAFAVWVADGQRARAERDGAGLGGEAAGLAMSAAEGYLRGGGLGGDADPEGAQFSSAVARQVALGPYFDGRASSQGLRLQMDVLAAAGNTRFWTVGLRAIASAPGAFGGVFGVMHPVVVLRRGQDGHWRVLQVSGNVAVGLMYDSVGAFAPMVAGVVPVKAPAVRGITEAAPTDGDTRAGTPELWWDNAGDSGLEVVEWQAHLAGGWSDTHMAFVPDTDSRTRTRVTATFFNQPIPYRWRVWSMGVGGVMVLSPWRRLTVLP